MKKAALHIILIIALINTSCELEKELNYHGFDEFNSKIIVHGFISPNGGAEVAISKSLPVNDVNLSSYLADADVILLEDGVPLLHLSEIDSGYFVSPSDFSLSINKGYHLVVNAPGFPEVKSTIQYLMPEIDIDSLVLVKDSITHQGYYLKFSFNDPGEVNNCYAFKHRATEFPKPILSTNKDEFFFDPFNDRAFNGELAWQSVDYNYNINNPNLKVINAYLYNISEEFSLFIESLDEYEYTRETIFFPVTSQIYSNISGGFGIFASYTYATKYLRIN